MRRILGLFVAVCAATPLVTGCNTGENETADEERTPLVRALDRIAATDATRHRIEFDDTAALTTLGGDSATGFGSLALTGAYSLSVDLPTVEKSTGLRPRSASYTITGGQAPAAVTLVAGGQDADEVEEQLAAFGWKADGNELVAPPLGQGGGDTTLPVHLARVLAEGSDVAYAGTDGRLSDVAGADGNTLADDRRVAALAGCLGDVVAARFAVGEQQDSPTMVAVGVRRPKASTDTPGAVACVSWPTSAAADAYTAELRDALARGTTRLRGDAYSELLKSSAVLEIGGDEHVVAWQADTPGSAFQVFELLLRNELPVVVV